MTARATAKVRPKNAVAVTAGVLHIPPDEPEDETRRWWFGEFEWVLISRDRGDDRFGLELAVKGPLAAADFYVKFPRRGRFYYGVGAQGGLGVGVYAIGSVYLTDKTFITVTARTMTLWGELSLFVGNDELVGAFVSAAHAPWGMDVNIAGSEELRYNFLMAGVRFSEF
jgi:hypothetical protein